MSNHIHREFRQSLFDIPSKDFQKHLKLVGNSRIIFSGKFGIGKSLFLDHFFNERTQLGILSDIKYDAFHIYPVNYSIASNDDIFRYIKYDVITTMLTKGIPLAESDFKHLDTLPTFIKGNLDKIIATLIYMIPKIGKDVYESYKKFEELKDEFVKHAQNKTQTEGDKLIEFLEKIENKEGSLFENDIITKIICNILVRLKVERERESVLIIDDLDRIDPEHVFRLLNVFAAHLDHNNGLANKLGFDKIIIVCDIENLRNIFRTKFGINTDFNGYIDKFYSINVYHLDNRETLLDISSEVFRSVIIECVDGHREEILRSAREQTIAQDICQMLINNGSLSLRTLLNKVYNGIEIDASRELRFDYNYSISQREVPTFFNFRILKEIVGGYEILKEYISKIPSVSFLVRDTVFFGNLFLYFLTIQKGYFKSGHFPVSVNEREYNLVLTGDMEVDIQKLLVYEGGLIQNNPHQYFYNVEEFRFLLLKFIDLLKKINN